MICTKQKHNNETEANKVANKLRSKHGVLRAYLCFDCMKWHLTSESSGSYLKRNKHITR